MARNTVSKLFLCFTLLLFWASFAWGQRDGVPTFSASESHEVDTVNLVTLVPSFNFPVISKSAGPLPNGVSIVAPGNCYQITTPPPSPHTYWTCGPGYQNGLTFYTTPFVKAPNVDLAGSAIFTTQTVNEGTYNCTEFLITGIAGGDGITTHPFNGSLSLFVPNPPHTPPQPCLPNTVTATTDDGSGITVSYKAQTNDTAPEVTSIYGANGWQGVTLHNTDLKDNFGNSFSYNSGTGALTDALGSVVTFTVDSNGNTTNVAYTDTTSTAQNVTLTQASAENFNPLGTCSAVNWPSTPFQVQPFTKIAYPDGTSYQIAYLANGNGTSGIINSVTLRTGGTVSYTYGSAATDCGWYFTSLSRVTADGTTSFSSSTSGGTTTTTKLDPGKNKTVWTFKGPGTSGNTQPLNTFLAEVDVYQNTGTVGSPSYTQISTTKYCYNISGGVCQATPAYPITERDTDQYIGSSSGTHMSHRVEQYDSYGNTTSDAITDEITSQTLTTTTVYGTYSGGSCSSIGSSINDHPCTITVKNGTTQLSQTQFTYNTTTAPGALTAKTNWLSATSSLTTNYTPNTNGTYASIQAPNGQTTSYTYSTTGGCPTSGTGLLPTATSTTVNSIALTTAATWNCDGGVVTSTTDYNGNEDDTTYDSMFRVASYTDRLENATTFSYTPTSIQTTDPVGVVRYTYIDSLGRPSISQTKQSPSSSNYDTVSRAYQWNGTNFQTQTSVPCVTTLDNTCSTVAMTTLVNPAFGAISNTDANSGTLTYARNSNDASVTAGPAPSGEHTKVAQNEVDGFGRIKSTCLLESSGGTSCGQVMGNSGILTSASYSFGTGSSTTTATRGSQTHTTVVDALERTTSVTTPEAGTVTYFYDTIPSAGCWVNPASQAGFLTATKDNSGTYTCPGYDGLGRVQYVLSGNYCKRFYYDNSNGYYGQGAPSGYPSSGANLMGRLVEAETDNCVWNPKPVIITDEWLAYDKDGRMTDMWESTPNSGGYFHSVAAYDADSSVTSLTMPGNSNFAGFTWGYDGEDRPNALTIGSNTTIISATAGNGFQYDAASRPLNVPIGTSGDQDTFTYDGVGNMTGYTFAVNSKSDAGVLTWNSNGSLQKLAITDTFNSGGSQTCTFTYDDVARITDDNCGSTLWHQTFNYGVNGGEYENLTKTGNPGTTWNPGYNTTNNEMTGSSYDNAGRLTYDGTRTYSWNAYGKMAGTISGNNQSFTCTTSGAICPVYDAFDRVAEVPSGPLGNTYNQVLYTPVGKAADMSCINCVRDYYIPAPGGGAFFMINSIQYFEHPDWLGSMRLMTTLAGRAYDFDTALTPYGESYNTFTASGGLGLQPYDTNFTGDIQPVAAGLFNTPNRELATNASRWLSPDPAHASWNAYAYPTDPNTQTDPSGLQWINPRNIEGWRYLWIPGLNEKADEKAQEFTLHFDVYAPASNNNNHPPIAAVGLPWEDMAATETSAMTQVLQTARRLGTQYGMKSAELDDFVQAFSRTVWSLYKQGHPSALQGTLDVRFAYDAAKAQGQTGVELLSTYTSAMEKAQAVAAAADESGMAASILGEAGTTLNMVLPFGNVPLMVLTSPIPMGMDWSGSGWGTFDAFGNIIGTIGIQQQGDYINSVLNNIYLQQTH